MSFYGLIYLDIFKEQDFIQLQQSWSSLVEWDEQLDRSNSQTTMELCNACVADIFWD